MSTQRRSLKQEFYREVQSEPEDGASNVAASCDKKKSKIRRKIDKNRRRQPEISQPFHLQNSKSKSMGRLDGLKQVRTFNYIHIIG